MHNWGARVEVVISKPAAEFTRIPAHQLDILNRMQVPVHPAESGTRSTVTQLVVDGLIGYSLAGSPVGSTADLIRWANVQKAPILALDAPSGVDATTGTVFDPAIRATATMTLALPKEGLSTLEARANVGELYLADISVPPALYAGDKLGVAVGPLFARSDVIRIH